MQWVKKQSLNTNTTLLEKCSTRKYNNIWKIATQQQFNFEMSVQINKPEIKTEKEIS